MVGGFDGCAVCVAAGERLEEEDVGAADAVEGVIGGGFCGVPVDFDAENPVEQGRSGGVLVMAEVVPAR